MNSGGEGGGRDVIMVEEAYKECTMVVRVEGKMLEWRERCQNGGGSVQGVNSGGEGGEGEMSELWRKCTRSEQWW